MKESRVFKCGNRFQNKKIVKKETQNNMHFVQHKKETEIKKPEKEKSFSSMSKSRFKKKENVTPETDLESGVTVEDIEENLNDSEV